MTNIHRTDLVRALSVIWLAGCAQGVESEPTGAVVLKLVDTTCIEPDCTGNVIRRGRNMFGDMRVDQTRTNGAKYAVTRIDKGGTAYDFALQDGSIVALDQGTGAVAWQGSDLVGARIIIEGPDSGGPNPPDITWEVEIAEVADEDFLVQHPNGPSTFSAYRLEYKREGEPDTALVSICAPAEDVFPEQEEMVAPLMGKARLELGDEPRLEELADWFHFGCEYDVLYKTRRLNHAPDGSNGVPLSDWKATIRMLTAEYCAAPPRHFTAPGVQITYQDEYASIPWVTDVQAYQPSPDGEPARAAAFIEAIWDEKGAKCMNEPRYMSRIDIQRECGKALPRCDTDYDTADAYPSEASRLLATQDLVWVSYHAPWDVCELGSADPDPRCEASVTSIQAAFDALTPVEKFLYIKDGVYTGDVAVDRLVYIMGNGPRTTVSGNARGTEVRGRFTFSAGVSASLLNMSISNPNGRGVDNNGTLYASDLAITGNAMAGDGAGIYSAAGSSLTLLYSAITGNTATGSGGGIWIGAGAEARIRHTLIEANEATSGSGGGLHVDGAVVEIERSNFVDNLAPAGAHEIELVGDGAITLTDVGVIHASLEVLWQSAVNIAAGSIQVTSPGTASFDPAWTCAPGVEDPLDLCGYQARDTTITSLQAGNRHTCVLLYTGDVRCWGAGLRGRLGYGSEEKVGDDEFPWELGDISLGGRVKQLAVGGVHNCALLHTDTATDAVRCWGSGAAGRLGYNDIADIGDNELPAAAGDVRVVRDSEVLEGWKVVQLFGGWSHTCALLEDLAAVQRVRCWGRGTEGQLGYGEKKDIGDDEHPTSRDQVWVAHPLAEPYRRIAQITGGKWFSCARFEDGGVRCWGYSGEGQLGYGNRQSMGDDEPPYAAGDVPLGGAATHIDAGMSHVCAVLDTGAVRCWGDGGNGRLGYDDTENVGDNETPASRGDIDLGAGVHVLQVSAGEFHNCALVDTDPQVATDPLEVRCWGRGQEGQLGYGNTQRIGGAPGEMPPGPVDLGASLDPIETISVGRVHSCARHRSGRVSCWGDALAGQLGNASMDTIGDDETPANAGDALYAPRVARLTGGRYHTCALLDTGRVRCWGTSTDGQLGYGNGFVIGDDEAPASAGDIQFGPSDLENNEVQRIEAGARHTCALIEANGSTAVRCWGDGQYGQLGQGDTDDIDERPAGVGDIALGATPLDIAVGDDHSCAIVASAVPDISEVRCWGRGGFGQLGRGSTENLADAANATSVGLPGYWIVQIGAGRNHTCALGSTGSVHCWGRNHMGQLGLGHTDNIGDDPADVITSVALGEPATAIAVGGDHTCALLQSAGLRCWGKGAAGQLGAGHGDNIGDGQVSMPPPIVDLGLGEYAQKVVAGGDHTCVLLESGAVRCWGCGLFGQLGNNDTLNFGDSIEDLWVDAGFSDSNETATDIMAGEKHTCAILDSGGVRCWGEGKYGQLGNAMGRNDIGDDPSDHVPSMNTVISP